MAKGAYIGVERFTPRNLPEGYTQVEYIQSSGTQYIDTGFKPNNNTRLTGDFEIVENDNNYKCIFGAREGSLARCFSLFTKSAQPFYSNIGARDDNYTFTNLPVLARHTADANKNIIVIDGVSYTHTARTFQNSSTTIYLCASNEDGTASMFCKMKWFSCQIYDNGTLVRDYVPCRNASGVLGLYDLVNGVFYQNAGSGSFTGGEAYGEVARKIKNVYLGVSNVARKIKKIYIGDANDKAKLCYVKTAQYQRYNISTSYVVNVTNSSGITGTQWYADNVYYTESTPTVDQSTGLLNMRRTINWSSLGNGKWFAYSGKTTAYKIGQFYDEPYSEHYRFTYTAIARVGTQTNKGALVDTIEAEEGAYPNNGISGNYWYVKVS